MLDEIYLKIQRANKHIDDLHGVLTDFKDSSPYAVAKKQDATTGEHIVYIASAKPIPDDIRLIAGDAIQNLYACLDYLAWQLVIAGGGKPTSLTAFPISEHIPDTQRQKARFDRQVNGMRDEVKQVIKELNPYRGQPNNFWRLQKLNNLNKHRTLLAVCFNTTSVSAWGDILNTGKLNWGQALNQGSEIARFPADSNNHEQIHFNFDVAFNEPEADAVRYPLIVGLRLFFNLVYRTVQKFDAYR